jgi:membrane protein YqaA with SNARE-associated domain
MRELLALLLLGIASAVVPIINIEAYLSVRAAVASVDAVWVMSLVAAVGQMIGKIAWYYLGASSLRWEWVRRRADKPKNAARLETWRARTHERPVFTGAVVFVSAFTGFPPFAVLSVLAGQLRMSLTLFLTLGLAGRWLRFAAVLGGAAWLSDLMR